MTLPSEQIPVELTPPELLLAATVGIHRHVAALKRDLKDAAGFDGIGWNEHIEGSCGEMAVAKVCNVFWSATINTFRVGGDLGRWQVRTRSRREYELIIRPDDDKTKPYILVVGLAPRFTVIGWIAGTETAQHPEWIQTHGGRPEAWFVPHKALQSILTLPFESMFACPA